jgi:hypothetical protein
MELPERIAEVLREAGTPLTSAAIAARCNTPEPAIHDAIWSNPSRFVWQPGHRWFLTSPKVAATPGPIAPGQLDAKDAVRPESAGPLRAITLSSGLRLVVSERALDSEAPFVVRSTGPELQLIVNRSHAVFDHLPVPFKPGVDDSPFRLLLELLVEAWAVAEGSAQASSERRTLSAIRERWGRALADLVETRD